MVVYGETSRFPFLLNIKYFIYNVIDVLYILLTQDYYIEFGNVHRFGSRQNNTNGTEIRPRPIVARFLYYNDLAYVLECAKRLRGKPYGINQQFPLEIENRRRSLYPVMKDATNRGKRVKLVRDRLFINNEEYVPEEEQITTSFTRFPLFFASFITGYNDRLRFSISAGNCWFIPYGFPLSRFAHSSP
jgi:hypothetical protein